MMCALVWVQHLLGTGHTVRAAALARALAAEGVGVTLLLGATPPATLDLCGLDVVALPPVLATDATFRHLVGPDGTPYADLAPRRAALVADVAAGLRPDIVLTETFPFGRRAFAAELAPMLDANAGRAVVAASLRDVLVRKAADKEAEMVTRARRWYDAVLVHADPAFVRIEDSFGLSREIAGLVRYTGFVHAAAPGGVTAATGEVVVSAGGGGVGAGLIEAALGAARLTGLRWRVLVPAALSPRLDAWRAAAPDNAVVEGNRPDFSALLKGAAVSVSQAGYNTVLDVLEAGVRAVFVPFAAHEETEQTARAEALARRGLAHVLPEAALSAEALAAAVSEALLAPLPPRPPLDLSGATRSAKLLVALAEGRR